MRFGCFWIFRNNSTLQKYENLSRWYGNRIYRTCLTVQNLREKLMVTMITMPFCRAWKTTSNDAISFHIGCTLKKITGAIVFTQDVQKWQTPYTISFKKIFFAFRKKDNKWTETCRISCSIILSEQKLDLGGWQIYDLIRRCPLIFIRCRDNLLRYFWFFWRHSFWWYIEFCRTK
jgi:hypothetical protein